MPTGQTAGREHPDLAKCGIEPLVVRKFTGFYDFAVFRSYNLWLTEAEVPDLRWERVANLLCWGDKKIREKPSNEIYPHCLGLSIPDEEFYFFFSPTF